MPRNGAGIFSLPAGSTITNGDVSDASDLNIPFADIVADLNDARPIVAGGTGASSAAAARTNLGLAIGTNVQAYDATLTSLAALGTAADRFAYTTGVDTWAEAAVTAFGRSLIDDADATAAHGTLGTLAFLGNNVPTGATDLGASADLNTVTTPGFYQQPISANAASGSNYPVAQAGALAVYESGATLGGVGAGVVQVYTQYWRAADGRARMFFRSEYNNTWSPWAEIASTAQVTVDVPSAIAALTAGAIGTYVFAYSTTASDVGFGSTRAGSALQPTSAARSVDASTSGPQSSTLGAGSALSGTWRCMGTYDHTEGGTSSRIILLGATLWLRIS